MNAVRPAATVVLLRDAPTGDGEVEVFLARRAGGAGFMAGATVFPGGKVDPADATLGPAPGALPRAARESGRPEAELAGYAGAAVRELCEEAGVVLARQRSGTPPQLDVLLRVRDAVAAERQGHRVPADAFARALAAEDLVADTDAVALFAWWVTPEAEPARFDTLFYAACLPPGQQAEVDGIEGTESFWLTPQDAVRRHATGEAIVLPPPTHHTLVRIAALSGDARSRVAALAEAGVGPRIQPHFEPDSDDGPTIALPDDPLHPDATAEDAERRNRFVFRDGRLVHIAQAPRI